MTKDGQCEQSSECAEQFGDLKARMHSVERNTEAIWAKLEVRDEKIDAKLEVIRKDVQTVIDKMNVAKGALGASKTLIGALAAAISALVSAAVTFLGGKS